MTDSKEMINFKQTYFGKTGQMAREAMAAKAAAGIYPLRLPIGYRRVYTGSVERIEIDPEIAPLVKLAFHLITKKRSSLSKVLATVRAKGLKGHSRVPISWGALHRLLTNPFYVGRFEYRGQTHVGRHVPLVSARMFSEVKHSLSDRIKRAE